MRASEITLMAQSDIGEDMNYTCCVGSSPYLHLGVNC